jgi:transcription elongation factor SPT5
MSIGQASYILILPTLLDGFIEQDEDRDNEVYQRRTANENQALDLKRRREEEMDAEKIAAELRERYRSQRGLTARSDYAEVPQRMLMPSVNDPGLYAVRCRVSLR